MGGRAGHFGFPLAVRLNAGGIAPACEASLGNLIGWLPAVVALLLSLAPLRKAVLTGPAYGTVRKILPTVSDTEQQALEAGSIGFDAELFSGNPDWDKLRAVAPVQLTDEERAFLDGPTEELCRMIDDWQIRHNDMEIPEEIWDFVKKHGFLGMLISKQHGGLGFSAQAQSLDPGKNIIALAGRRDHCHGAEFTGAGRTDRKIRNGRAEGVTISIALPRARRSRVSR